MAKRFVSHGGKPTISTAKLFQRWNDLPYGRWTCGDGRVVLFNRFYEPIWNKPAGGDWAQADASEWVKGIEKQEWFYNDATPEPQKRKRAQAALNDALVPLPA